MKQILSNKLYIFLFAFPGLLLFTGFVFYPMVSTMYMGFFNSDGLSKPTFVGFDNFIAAINSREFLRANSASLFLSLLAIVFDAMLAILVAILMQSLEKKYQKVFRTSFLIPLVLSITVISQLWLAIYDADWGLLNKLLAIIGLGTLQNAWLINEKSAMICVAIVGMWQYFGFFTLLAYSGLKTIPEQYYEAAKIDGANFFNTTMKITLPMLAEVSKVCLIIATVGGLYTFPQVFIMTGGGPGDMTQTIMMYIYKSVFSVQKFEYGSAVASMVIVESFAILLVINKFIARERLEY